MDIICNQESGSRNAIQYAIDALPARGGRVIVPAGHWESAPIRLRDGVELHLEAGADVWFSSDPGKDQQDWKCSPLILIDHVTTAAISGRGTIHGGISCKDTVAHPIRFLHSLEQEAWQSCVSNAPFACPALIELRDCAHVLLHEFRIDESLRAAVRLENCQHIRISNINVRTTGTHIPGITLEGCSSIELSACRLYTSGNTVQINAEGKTALPSRQIEIRNCYFEKASTAMEICPCPAGVEDVHIKRCVIHHADKGISFPWLRAGGYLRHCEFENIQISSTTTAAIDFPEMKAEQRAEEIPFPAIEETVPEFSDILLKSMYGERNARGIVLDSLTPTQKEAIRIDNIGISVGSSGSAAAGPLSDEEQPAAEPLCRHNPAIPVID